MRKLFFSNGTSENVASLGVLILRLSIGLMMLLGHGWEKFKDYSNLKEKFTPPDTWILGWMNNTTCLVSTIFAEVVCCALIVIGFATRPAAAVLAFTMTIAAFVSCTELPFFMSQNSPHAKEPAILYLIPAVVIFIMGAGKYSFDAALSVEKKRMFR